MRFFALFLFLMARPSFGAVILHESWEASDGDALPFGDSADRMYISPSPDYCVNPEGTTEPPAGCSYDQFMGYPPVTSSDTCCRHSINIGTTSEGFPVHEGSRSLRFWLANGDPPVKSHTSRAEMNGRNVNPGGKALTTLNSERWYGVSLFVEGPLTKRYAAVNFIQWHHVPTGNGVPGLLKLDDRSDGSKRWFWVTTAPLGTWDIVGETDADEDFNRWSNWVFHIQWDKDPGEGFVEIWKDHPDGTWDKFIDDDYVYQEDEAPYIHMGIDYATDNSVNDRPFIWYFDSWTVGDENSNFDEVNPQQFAETPGDCTADSLLNCNATECAALGFNWCAETCQIATCTTPSAPTLTLVQPTEALPHGTTVYTTRLTSDQACVARFQYSPERSFTDFDFGSMTGVPTLTNGSTHEKEMPSLDDASDFYQYWKCENENGTSLQAEVHVDVADTAKRVDVGISRGCGCAAKDVDGCLPAAAFCLLAASRSRRRDPQGSSRRTRRSRS
jgi:hypothetical protein